MPQPATPSERTAAPTTGDDLHATLTSRTRSLFALLTAVHGGSRRSAARGTSIDPRCLKALRGVPTIGFVARIGQGLGLDATHAAGVVATTPRAVRSHGSIRAAIATADLHDDLGELSRLAAELQQSARDPGDLALSQLVVARTSSARGDLHETAVAVDMAMRFGLSAPDAACAAPLLQAIEGESAIAASRMGSGATATVRDIRTVLETIAAFDSTGHGGRCAIAGSRARCWSMSAHVLSRADGAANEHVLCDLLREVDAAPDPLTIAWTASITGETALVLRQRDHRIGLRTIVRCQLMLDEAMAREEGDVRSLVLRRRTRVALREWSTRAALGEIDTDTIDRVDAEELARIGLWFPDALRDPRFVNLSQHAVRHKITKSRR